jgi:hypothetical protein
MKRLRRAYQKRIRKCKKFRRRIIVTGTAAAITLGTGISLNRAFAVGMPDRHRLPVIQDIDADLLTNLEELAIGYNLFKADQNRNEMADGVELAKHCAAAIECLPWENEVTDPNQIYKWLDAMFGLETCDICGETVNMGSAGIVNPNLGLRVDCPLIAIHYMEHGSFDYCGDVHEGRLDVAALLRALDVRFPHDPNEHQLAVVENDFDGDLLTDSEELTAGYNLYSADQDNDLVADGIELARQCYEIIDALPVHDPNGPEIMYALYKEDFLQRGLEQCETCGQSVNMGYCRIVNSKLGLSIEVPYIVCHYMEHGSFSYSGDVHGEGRVDVPLLTKILEMPQRCGDLGTIYLPADLNNDCQVNIDDMVEFIEQWLNFSDPNQV